MQVQIVKGATRREALDAARRLYGPDPLVLAVRETRQGATPIGWEVQVARETPVAPDEDDTVEALPALSDALLATLEKRAAEHVDDLVIEDPVELAAPEAPLPTVTPIRPSPLATMRADLARIVARAANPSRGSMQEVLDFARRLAALEDEVCASMLSGANVGRAWLPLLDRLDKAGYPKAEAVALLQNIDRQPVDVAEVPDWTHYYRRLRRALAETIEVAPAMERVSPGVAVFVGGAGVGKTTLAAKLAADLSLGGARAPILGAVLPRRGVGLAALKRCANTLGVEFTEVSTAAELKRLESVAKDRPVILDSSSVNPFDATSMQRLGDVLDGLTHKEIHAVVPACHSSRDFAQSLSAFSTVGANRLAVTRLDEAPFVGRVIAAARIARMPISYLSQGPRIPDDLVRPGVDALLDAVLRPERNSAS